MRKTREQILTEVPSWSNVDNLVEKRYGDIPSAVWNAEQYTKWRDVHDVFVAEKIIWLYHGDYFKYETEIGDVYTSPSGEIMSGFIRVTYRGRQYYITVDKLYGRRGLGILLMPQGEKGICQFFYTTDRLSMKDMLPRMKKELTDEVISKILSSQLCDYGEILRTYLREAQVIYEENKGV